jgi:hypothetical protein
MAEQRLAFRLPLPGLPRALFVTDYGLRGGQLLVDDVVVLDVRSSEELARGVSTPLGGTKKRIAVHAVDGQLRLALDGIEVRPEEDLRAETSRSAWIHGFVALAGSAFGFIASYLYVLRAEALGDPWPMRMALHMAAWHLLLTLTLFPASVWGQRVGIRAVQAVSLLFFAIHVGIALSNAGAAEVETSAWIALLNAASGLAFLAAVIYGQRAHADMDPVRVLWLPRAPTAHALHRSAELASGPSQPASRA